MIPRSAITHWNKQVPWEDIANVEQDLIITRALTDIFADEFLSKELAFRGGTANLQAVHGQHGGKDDRSRIRG